MAKASDRDALAPGEIVDGKYRIEAPVAQGGIGVVVRATQLQLERDVAIKFLKPAVRMNEAIVERFEREGRLAAKITSEHVVHVHDVGRTEASGPYIVMEYLQGQDLGHLLAEGTFGVELAIDYVLQACDALAEAHKLRIVHRDLKPENLFVATRGPKPSILKIVDFGISKVAPLRGEDGSWAVTTDEQLGTPVYMSPEQLEGIAAVDHRSDIWSLGVVLHELLAGVLPFTGETIPQICTRILNQPAVRIRSVRPDVPERVEDAILRCLAKDPIERFESVAELAAALAPYGPKDAADRVARMRSVLASDDEIPVDVAPVLPDPSRLAPTVALDRKPARPLRAIAAGVAGAVVALVAILVMVRASRQETLAKPAVESPATTSGVEATPTVVVPKPENAQTAPSVAATTTVGPSAPSRAAPPPRVRRPAGPTPATTTTANGADRRAGFGERK